MSHKKKHLKEQKLSMFYKYNYLTSTSAGITQC